MISCFFFHQKRLGLGRGKKKPFSEVSPNTNGQPYRLRPGKTEACRPDANGAAGLHGSVPKSRVTGSRRASNGFKMSPKGRRSSPKERKQKTAEQGPVKASGYVFDSENRENECPEVAEHMEEHGGYHPALNVRLMQDDPSLPQSPARRTTFIKGTKPQSQPLPRKDAKLPDSPTKSETVMKSKSSFQMLALQEQHKDPRAATASSTGSSSSRIPTDAKAEVEEGTAHRKIVEIQMHMVAFSASEESEIADVTASRFGEAYDMDQATGKGDIPVGAVAPMMQNGFMQEGYTLGQQHHNRVELIKDDPSIPESPARRTTFLKDDHEMPLTPLRRTTFQKDDPEMPLTPIRRMTYNKANRTFGLPASATDAGSLRSRSASPPKTGWTPQSIRFSDDLGTDRQDTPSSVLIRQGTYTKLNGSLSPGLGTYRLQFTPTSPQIPEGSCSSDDFDLDITSDSLEKAERQKRSLESTDSLPLAVKPLMYSDHANSQELTETMEEKQAYISGPGDSPQIAGQPQMTSVGNLQSPESIELKPMAMDQVGDEYSNTDAGMSKESSPTDSEYITPLSTKYATPCGGSPGEYADDFDVSIHGLTPYFDKDDQRRETLVQLVSEKLSHLSESENFGHDATDSSVLLKPTVLVDDLEVTEVVEEGSVAVEAKEIVGAEEEHFQTTESSLERTTGGSSTFDKSNAVSATLGVEPGGHPEVCEEQGDSPTSVLMNESFGGHRGILDRLESVKVELQHRLSSTPVNNPLRAQRGFSALNPASVLSPIIGQRVDQETVVKTKPVILVESTEDSKKQLRKELFAEKRSEEHMSRSAKLFETLSTCENQTKAKPSPCGAASAEVTTVTTFNPVVCSKPPRKTSVSSKKPFASSTGSTTVNKPDTTTKMSAVRRSVPGSCVSSRPPTRGRSLQTHISSTIAASLAPSDPQKRCHSTERVVNRVTSTGREVKKIKKGVENSHVDSSSVSMSGTSDPSSASLPGRQWTRTQQLRRSGECFAGNVLMQAMSCGQTVARSPRQRWPSKFFVKTKPNLCFPLFHSGTVQHEEASSRQDAPL